MGQALAEQRHSSTQGFEHAVALNEAAKHLLELAYRVNLLAIDAMLQSKRGGALLPGFDEVSAQMRRWTHDLRQQLEGLNGQCRDMVTGTSRLFRQARLFRLLSQAVERSKDASLSAVWMRERDELASLRAANDRDWLRLLRSLEDLDQLGTMAVVLSRSAMIEAAAGDETQRALLGQVSAEFQEHSRSAAQTIRSVLRALRTDIR